MRVLLEIGCFYQLNLKITAGLIKGLALLEVLRYFILKNSLKFDVLKKKFPKALGCLHYVTIQKAKS